MNNIITILSKKMNRRLLGVIALAVVLLAVGAWESLFDATGVRVGETARLRVESYTWHDEIHKVRLVHDPAMAFEVRRRLIREASESIDICTFIWRDDDYGLALLQDLVAAARRGVRVRLLGDGMFFMRKPAKAAAIAEAHPNIEFRLYNPVEDEVATLDPTILENMLFEFDDVNQRLHMKILLADGRLALVGGRNIGAEYFGRDDAYNFIDRDLLLEGSAVADVLEAFELFWRDTRTKRASELEDIKASNPAVSWLRRPVPPFGGEGETQEEPWFEVRRVSVWYDRPGVIGDEEHYVPELLADRMAALVGAAERSVVIESPYVVLGERSVDLFKRLRDRKPQLPVRILTNSLAATDNWQTYAAFQSQLRTMLGEYRFEIYVKKPDSLKNRSGLPGATAGLHEKTAIVDRKRSAIGSYNWDPRSGVWNAEIMVVIEDEPFAESLLDYLEPLRSPEVSWVVAERQQPIGLEQIDAIGSALHTTLAEFTGVNVWPLTNTACFEWRSGRRVSPYHPEFYEYYKDVGSFPGVPLTDRKRILTNLLEPFSGPLVPTL